MAMIRREMRRCESFSEFVSVRQTRITTARCAARKHRRPVHERAKALLEVTTVAVKRSPRRRVPLAASLWCLTVTPVFGNIGTHVQVEDGLTIGPAVVDAVQAHR